MHKKIQIGNILIQIAFFALVQIIQIKEFKQQMFNSHPNTAQKNDDKPYQKGKSLFYKLYVTFLSKCRGSRGECRA